MLRKIADDLKGKSYAARAREEAHISTAISRELAAALSPRRPKAANAIRSVVEVRGTVVVRASSRAGLSELYQAREIILKVLRGRGISSLRFTI